VAALSLVDPDNRREVGFARTRSDLTDLDTSLDTSFDASFGLPDALARGSGGVPRETESSGRPRGVRGVVPPEDNSDLDFFSRAKLLVTSRALRLRRARPEWFAGDYEPLAASGPSAGHAVAFRRGGKAVTVVTRLPVGLRRRGGWQDTALPLPALPGGAWADLLTGTVHQGPVIPMTELTGRLPVALLVQEAE
jgi:(1->4)-alpha-D-glucan 1-alpha-D-glucosylmutase